MPIYPGYVCCSGLKAINPVKPNNKNKCPANLVGAAICTYCGDGKCGLGENKCNCNKDCKGVTPSPNPSPTPSPEGKATFTLKVKLDGVPANNNDMNLPPEFRSRVLKVTLVAKDGTETNQEVNFTYAGNGIWEGKL